MRKLGVLAVLSALLALVVTGCSSAPTGSAPAPEAVAQTFVGTVEGSEIYLALQVGVDGAAQAYLCDSTSIAQVLSGRQDPDGTVALTGEADTRLSARVDGATATGTVLVAGTERPFTAELAEGRAGFYRAEGEGVVIGWVLLNDGTQQGSINIDEIRTFDQKGTGETPAGEGDQEAPIEEDREFKGTEEVPENERGNGNVFGNNPVEPAPTLEPDGSPPFEVPVKGQRVSADLQTVILPGFSTR